MQKLISIISTCGVLSLSLACSKPSDNIESEFSFTYKGKEYFYTSVLDSVGVTFKAFGSIYINRSDVFGGKIYFDIRDCAYLAPEFIEVTLGGNCVLSILKNGMIIPIDSSNVFSYQSGSLNLTISDCNTNTIQVGFGTITISTCTASGTFDLTLVNKNNETIELTNGIINNYTVYY